MTRRPLRVDRDDRDRKILLENGARWMSNKVFFVSDRISFLLKYWIVLMAGLGRVPYGILLMAIRHPWNISSSDLFCKKLAFLGASVVIRSVY